MKLFRKLFLVALVLFSVTLLVACGEEKEPTPQPEEEKTPVNPIDVLPTEIDHYFSNQISFADMNLSLGDNKFLKNKLAKLKLKSVTDGDTAVFYLDGESDGYTNALGKSYDYLTVRFLAIDTPESTSSIAPWGKKASNYAKEVLGNAEGIIVDATSIDTSDSSVYPTVYDTYKSGCRLDSNGTRWLALIWYCPQGLDPENLANYRSYQLDMIEECYSLYTGNLGETPYIYNSDKTLEPKLYDRYFESGFGSLTLGEVMLEADIRMQTLKLRKSGGQIDPDYDYSKTPTSYTITEAVANFDELTKQNKFVELTGVITAFVGVNFYFQDREGTPLYVYMGLDAKSIGSLFKVGDTIKIRGRLSEFGGQMQLTDIVWAKETFVKVTGADAIPMPEVIELTTADLTTDKLDQYLGKLIKMTLNGQSCGGQSKDGSYTLYTSNIITGKVDPSYNKMSIRINGPLHPGYDYTEYEAAWDNKKIEVVGIMATYLEADLTKANNYPSYQIVLGNRTYDADGNLLSDIVIK